MNWNQVRQFYNDGYNIQSHRLSHTRLTDLKSENEIQSVISRGKECLEENSELMFLNCDGWENFGNDKENYDGTTDCGPYFSDGTPTPTNKLTIKEWSHDR